MTDIPSPTTPTARRKARRLALQALYQYQIAGGTAAEIEAYYRAENDTRKTDVVYFHELVSRIIEDQRDVDQLFAAHLDRAVRDLDPIERAILRIATYELKARIDVPVRVVINEAIELAKDFGATDGHRYVNGVVDRVARDLRAVELANRPARG